MESSSRHTNIVTVSLPEKPQKPLDGDCCGQGCVPCVLDLYDQEIEIWEEECRRILSGEDAKEVKNLEDKWERGPVLNPKEYHPFKVERVIQETHDSFRFRFMLPHGISLGLQTGQHIVVRGSLNGETITRQFTPVTDVCTKSYFELLIKVYERGKMSQIVRTWQTGTMVEMRGPFGQLEYRANKYKRLYMLAAGSGITPIAQVIQTILTNEDDETLLHLIYTNKTYKDILLKSELDEWRRFWNFTVVYALSQEPAENRQYKHGERIYQGRVDPVFLKDELTNIDDRTMFLVCGTRSFEKDVIDFLKDELGVRETNYFKF